MLKDKTDSRQILFAALFSVVLSIAACAEENRVLLTETGRQEFVDLQVVIPSVQLDIRYFTATNFAGRRIDGYEAPKCLLTRKAALALKTVQMELTKKKLGVKVFDCYRPQRAVDHFIRWANDVNDQKTKAAYYPSVDKKDLFKLGYLAEKSGHSRGSTADLTLIDLMTTRELDMGTDFDFFDPRSNMDNPLISKIQRENRTLLKAVMERHGFTNLKSEWWHFTLQNETFPDTYFNFDVK